MDLVSLEIKWIIERSKMDDCKDRKLCLSVLLEDINLIS